MRGFLPLWSVTVDGYSGPALLRYVLWPLSAIPMTEGTKTYPANSLWGGPTTTDALRSPQGRAFIRALQTWAMAYGYIGNPEIVPIAPEAHGHRWPRKGWAWEMRRELEPAPRYTLAGVPPSNFWKRVA